ncbi:serpin family protein [Lutibacter sp. HS1-25]|uniref:serpin family protein n=1 Tax=Lutibacter sp. HS1-25 TaxID=2485000 RepID=UPI0010128119|nr:serpin family protein [Lutibacter sp. HS1-25]RXP59383.1 serpin family protein [Lutibacter sp. HS1-25]
MMNYKPITILAIVFLTITNLGQLKAQNSELSKSFNQFSFDLYHEIKLEKGNVFLSPLSSYYALLSAYEGSKNKTKEEFENVLYLKDSAFTNSDYPNKFTLKTDSLAGLKISNAVWVDKRFQVEPAFKNAVSNKYSSDFKQTEFANTKQAVSDINYWVADKTNQRITNMVSPTDINSETKLMISNAVYFKGEWLKKFEKHRTAESTFFTDNENQYKVDFMNTTEKLNYFENDAFQFVAKPYKDSYLSFCMMLPKELNGLEAVEKSLNANFFDEILEKSSNTEVWISMPKIKMEASYKLKSALTNMGLNTVFNNEADFSGILKNEPLAIAQVAHKTYFDINEDYTEATAATTTIVYIRGMPSYKTFKADHPFVFFIIDTKTKAIVFMGRYVTPEDGKMIDKADFENNIEKRVLKNLGWNSGKEPLLILTDGKKMKEVDIQDVNFKNVIDFKVYTKKEDIEKYTTKAYYGIGVVVFTVKKIKKGIK